MVMRQMLSGSKKMKTLLPSLILGKTSVKKRRNDVHNIYPYFRMMAWSPLLEEPDMSAFLVNLFLIRLVSSLMLQQLGNHIGLI